MSESTRTSLVGESLARVQTDLDDLRDLPLGLTADDELLDVWRELEVISRRLSSIEHAVISQVSSRRLHETSGARTMAAFARGLLGIDIGDARTRLAAAEVCGPRQSLTGEPLPPICPEVSAAQARGEIGNRHARIIVEMIEALPDVVQVERGPEIEAFFVERAKVFDPASLQKLADRQLECEGVEGTEPEYRERRRDFRLHVRPDGSCNFGGEGTAELAEYLRVGFDAFARPCNPNPTATEGDKDFAPTPAPIKDPRTPGQRRHDAIIDLIKAAMRAGEVPPVGGIAATIVLTVDVDDWTKGTGSATTGHGVRVPTNQAKSWVSGDARVIAVVLDRLRAVIAYSDCRRIFTENQRLAMNARDGGCAFPGCDAPLHRCEAHHVIDFALGGPTSTDFGALLCPGDHRTFEQQGWRGVMIEGIPHFVPPKWIDPQQRPLRNWMHHPHLGSSPPSRRGSPRNS